MMQLDGLALGNEGVTYRILHQDILHRPLSASILP